MFKRLLSYLRRRQPEDQGLEGEASAQFEKQLLVKLKNLRSLPQLAQWRYLPQVLSRLERLVALLAGGLVVIGLVFLAAALLPRVRTQSPAPGGALTEGLIGAPLFINPLWASSNDVDRDLVRLIFAGLMTYNERMELVPDLAERFEISPDGKTYTFYLRPNLVWHDGVPLTASDVTFTLNLIGNPATKSVHQTEFRGLSAVALDERTVVFTLESPSALLPHLLTIGLLPEHRWSDVPPETARLAELNLKPIGAGPFRLKTLRKTKQGAIHSLTLEQNPRSPRPSPYLDFLTFKFYPDLGQALAALSAGNLDSLAFIPQERLSDLTRRRSLVYYDLDLPQLVALFFNQKKQPLLADKIIREALARATPKTELIGQAFQGRAKPVLGPILSGFLGYTEEVSKFEFDPNQSQALLDEQGWKLENGKSVRIFVPKDKKDKRFNPGAELKFSLLTVQVPEYVSAAEMIRDRWQKIGVGVNLEIIEPGKINREKIGPRNYEILLYGELLGAAADPFPFWHSSQIESPGVNLALYSNRLADALMAEARTLINETERARRWEELQKLIVSEIPAIFLLEPRYVYALDRRVQGVEFPGRLSSPADRFAGLDQWSVKTKTQFKIKNSNQ